MGRTLRDYQFYIEYMNNNIDGYRNRSPFHLDSKYTEKQIQNLIEGELNTIFYDIKKREQFVLDMQKAAYFKIIPDEYFDWMDDYASAYFIWSILVTMGMRETDAIGVMFSSELTPLLKPGGLQLPPLTKQEAFSSIINFFDGWDAPRNLKIRCISSLRSHWITFHKELPGPFKWIDDRNENQSSWAYDYVMNHIKPEYMPVFTRKTIQKNIVPFLTSVLYAWSAHIDTKRLMVQRMKKTYSQNVYRESIANKKVVNTYIQKEIKEKLDMLAKKNGRKINEELEAIIMCAWQQTNVTSDKN